jgi:predicted nucleic acid-binding protein
VRLYLDTGVIIAGCTRPWDPAKALLILVAIQEQFTVVYSAAVEDEVQNFLATQLAMLPHEAAQEVRQSFAGWFSRVRLERRPLPNREVVQSYVRPLIPIIRHLNDLTAVVGAIEARPDWVISGNQAHWNDQLADRTGLRIVTPRDFLRRFSLDTED